MSKIMDEIGLKIWETSLIPTKIALEIEAKKDKKREQQIIKEKEKEQKKIKEAEEKQRQTDEKLRKRQKEEEAKKLQEQKDRKKRIESLDKVLATEPISSLNIVGFRKIKVIDKYTPYMSLIEVVNPKGHVCWIYEDRDKYRKLNNWYDLSYFMYTPDKIHEIIDSLGLIIPRFEDVAHCINLSALEVSTGFEYIHKRVFNISDKYKLKDNSENLITLDEIVTLQQNAFKRFIQVHEFWTQVNSAHIFEREPYAFWKKKYKEMDEALEKELNRRAEIVKAKENEKIIQYGKEGEKKVEYALKWLPKEYAVIDRGEDGIQLQCLAVSNEKQEIDHIVISSKGVFLIETKNYAGKIIIDANGNWIREKEDGKQRGIPNPVQQLGRHHLIVQEILGIEDVFDVICIANEGSVIEGVENCPIAIVKFDMLAFYIQQYENNSGNVYSLDDIEKMKEKIDNHRIK